MVVVAEIKGSKIKLKENKRKYMRKKKGEETPPVELVIDKTTNVKITDSKSLEAGFCGITNFFKIKRTKKRNADICKS